MAQPSKRRPWVVQIQPPHAAGWYDLDAYAGTDEAHMQAELARKRTDAAIRVIFWELRKKP